jgi:hypothetical protein
MSRIRAECVTRPDPLAVDTRHEAEDPPGEEQPEDDVGDRDGGGESDEEDPRCALPSHRQLWVCPLPRLRMPVISMAAPERLLEAWSYDYGSRLSHRSRDESVHAGGDGDAGFLSLVFDDGLTRFWWSRTVDGDDPVATF